MALLLILAAGAWAATVAIARGMAGMTGTMGLGLALFVPVWTLMMAAMMLPSVAPTASLYARTFKDNLCRSKIGFCVVSCVFIGVQAARMYSLIRPLRTGFRRIWRAWKSPAVMQRGWCSASGTRWPIP